MTAYTLHRQRNGMNAWVAFGGGCLWKERAFARALLQVASLKSSQATLQPYSPACLRLRARSFESVCKREILKVDTAKPFNSEGYDETGLKDPVCSCDDGLKLPIHPMT